MLHGVTIKKYVQYFILLFQGRLAAMFTPGGLAMVAIQELTLLGGQLIYQYWKAIETAKEQAPQLAQTLLQLRQEHQKVQVIAESNALRFALFHIRWVVNFCWILFIPFLQTSDLMNSIYALLPLKRLM